MLSDERPEAIRARWRAALPGPWTWDDYHDLRSSQVDEDLTFDYGDGDVDTVYKKIICTDGGYYPPKGATKVAIAHAPTDIEALLAEVDRLRELQIEHALEDRLGEDN